MAKNIVENYRWKYGLNQLPSRHQTLIYWLYTSPLLSRGIGVFKLHQSLLLPPDYDTR